MDDYGFDILSNKLYEALIAYPPDFNLAQQQIREGADIHARNKDDDENILAQIILGYPHVDYPDEDLSQEERHAYWAQYDGHYLPEIVQFFLDNGFDVSLDNQKFGANCLQNLTWSSYDRFILDAAKLLLEAGASYTYEDNEHESVIDWVATKASLSANVDWNAQYSRLFCTMWDILDAHRNGKDYQSIDSCMCCIGEKIEKVLTTGKLTTATIHELPPPKKVTLCDQALYFICGNKPLQMNTYAQIKLDPTDIDNPDLIDVSDCFSSVIGSKIENILFPCFSDKSDGITSPIFVLQVTNGILIQCRSCRNEDHRQLEIYLLDQSTM